MLISPGVVILLNEAKVFLTLPLENLLPTLFVGRQVALRHKTEENEVNFVQNDEKNKITLITETLSIRKNETRNSLNKKKKPSGLNITLDLLALYSFRL